MPPKRTRKATASKSKAEEVAATNLIGEVLLRGINLSALSAPLLETFISEISSTFQKDSEWILEAKEKVKLKCREVAGAKAVPKTPKRMMAFSRIKETMNMFDNLGISRVKDEEMPEEEPEERPIARLNVVDSTTNVVEEEKVKQNGSPPVAAKTPTARANAVVKEEVNSAEVVPQRRTLGMKSGEAATTTVRSTVRATSRILMEHTEEKRALTPSKSLSRGTTASSSKTAPSPSRPTIATSRTLMQSPSRPAMRNGPRILHDNSKEMKEAAMRKLEEKKKMAELNREDALREKAERARRDREEKAAMVKMKKMEAAREAEAKRLAILEKEAAAAEIKRRQASPARNNARTPTRVDRMRAMSPEGGGQRLASKRMINSPLTPRHPVKHHRPITRGDDVVRLDESEEEAKKERERIEEERKKRTLMEAERARKIREEEERVALLKEEERKREEERRRLVKVEEEKRKREEMEKKRREEEEKKKDEEERKKKNTATPLLKNKHLANVSMNESVLGSYEMTPEKIYQAATETNYGVDDLSSEDETDDEENPRKKVPKWATQPQLSRTLAKIALNPPFDPDVFFGPITEPDLNVIFTARTKYKSRTSSAMWQSPLSNPTKGKSRLYN